MDDFVITEVSALQTKLLYLHFKSVKINDDIQRINSINFTDSSSKESITKKGEIAYNLVDIISLFEGYWSLADNIFKYKNVSTHLNSNLNTHLKDLRRRTGKWKHVRNKIGGHLDINTIIDFCEDYNYKGVFISNELEADFKGVLILQMIESAVNSTLEKSHLFKNDLILTEPRDLNLLIDKINEDWLVCLQSFEIVSKFLYKMGKKDKLHRITADDIGIIKFDK
ncbi:hypothetical protein SAMN04488028_101559 [Reichenbachiella agariperforans]|uniref:Uncharacterized protein n=1 Tax=Reichenbachiella agariperforans TaxID=156994 RepID=A0A1M6KFW6_REIAG|nr:hypothetical protein [Reichenbachiella agariperforans]SHJ57742.1 hypothetical protein SAMN04488028_101559 [Reichenbachiella agariperforans]